MPVTLRILGHACLAAALTSTPGCYDPDRHAARGALGTTGDGQDDSSGPSPSSGSSDPALTTAALPTTEGGAEADGSTGTTGTGGGSEGTSGSGTTGTTRATSTEVFPTCGDEIIEGDEQCDAVNLDGQSCATLGFAGGTLTCSAICQFDTSACFL